MYQPAPPSQLVSGVLALQNAARITLPADASQTISASETGWLILTSTAGAPSLSSSVLTCALPSGHACVFPAGETVTLTATGADVELLALHLSGAAADQLLGSAAREGAFFYPNGGPAVQEVVSALMIAAQNGLEVSGEAASLQAYALLLRLAGTASTPETVPAYPQLITAAIAIIQEQFAHLSGITELAELLEVSPNHLIRQFTRTVGMTPGKFLNHVRIEYAKLLLRDPDMNVQSVAEASGFSCAGYFIKVFRKETGSTPGQYAAATARSPFPAAPDRGAHYLF